MLLKITSLVWWLHAGDPGRGGGGGLTTCCHMIMIVDPYLYVVCVAANRLNALCVREKSPAIQCNCLPKHPVTCINISFNSQ